MFEAEIEKKWLEVAFEAETGTKYKTNTKQINLVIHNIDWQPQRIKINGKKTDVNWSSENKTLSIPVVWNTKNDIAIKIKK